MKSLSFKRKHREPLELQLTAMIDIFSMIVIFLILGSVFGGADIELPKGLALPRSTSEEISGVAPTVGISRGKVTVSLLRGIELPVSQFARGRAENDPTIAKLRGLLKEHVQKLPEKERSLGVLLNVVADQETPYEDVFNTARVFRETGFNTLLFVAMPEGKRSGT